MINEVKLFDSNQFNDVDFKYHNMDYFNNKLPIGKFQLSSKDYIKSGDKAEVIVNSDESFDYKIYRPDNSLKIVWSASKIDNSKNFYKFIQNRYTKKGNLYESKEENNMILETEIHKNNNYDDNIEDRFVIKVHKIDRNIYDSTNYINNNLDGTRLIVIFYGKGIVDRKVNYEENLKKFIVILSILILVYFLFYPNK